jgi:hypothetical protein
VRNLETKVLAACAGSGLGAAFAQFMLWFLAVLVWHAPDTAKAADSAPALVPGPVAWLITVLVSVLGAYLGGYNAPHTFRPDLSESNGTVNVYNTTGSDTASVAASVASTLAAATDSPAPQPDAVAHVAP